jgi:16S rRNA (cytosine1402-N4)-methyltransferase
VIRETPEPELAARMREYGEFGGAARLARRLKDDARRNRMNTVADFAAACLDILGARVRKMPSAILPAQALRILTNRELDRLDSFLAAVPDVVAPGGRVAAISFHSLEDRRVKRAFQGLARSGAFSLVTRKPMRPSAAEVARNRRARSAHLRVVVRNPGTEDVQ